MASTPPDAQRAGMPGSLDKLVYTLPQTSERLPKTLALSLPKLSIFPAIWICYIINLASYVTCHLKQTPKLSSPYRRRETACRVHQSPYILDVEMKLRLVSKLCSGDILSMISSSSFKVFLYSHLSSLVNRRSRRPRGSPILKTVGNQGQFVSL